MIEHESLLRASYEAFNRRDFDLEAARFSPEIDWPDLLEGTTLHGHAEVLAYWYRQLEVGDPRVRPERFSIDDRGRTVVLVHQVLSDREGRVLADQRVGHAYTFGADGLITRMDVLADPG